MIWGWRIGRHRPMGRMWLRLTALPVTLLLWTVALAAIGGSADWPASAGAGGRRPAGGQEHHRRQAARSSIGRRETAKRTAGMGLLPTEGDWRWDERLGLDIAPPDSTVWLAGIAGADAAPVHAASGALPLACGYSGARHQTGPGRPGAPARTSLASCAGSPPPNLKPTPPTSITATLS